MDAVRQGTLGVDGRGEDEEEEKDEEEEAEEATNIKSNNPHLAGGEHVLVTTNEKNTGTPSLDGGIWWMCHCQGRHLC